MLGFSKSGGIISASVEAKLTRIALVDFGLTVEKDDEFSRYTEFRRDIDNDDKKTLLSSAEFREKVYEWLGTQENIERFEMEYERVLFECEYDGLIFAMCQTPRIEKELNKMLERTSKRLGVNAEDLRQAQLDYIKSSVKIESFNEMDDVSSFIFKYLHMYFEKTYAHTNDLNKKSMDETMGKDKSITYRQMDLNSAVEEDTPFNTVLPSTNIKDLLCRAARATYIYFTQQTMVNGVNKMIPYYDLASFAMQQILEEKKEKLNTYYVKNLYGIASRFDAIDINVDLTREKEHGTKGQKKLDRERRLRGITARGLVGEITRFSSSFGYALDSEENVLADKNSLAIAKSNNVIDHTVLERKHCQLLLSMLAFEEIKKETAKFNYTVFDLPVELFRLKEDDYYRVNGLPNPMANIRPTANLKEAIEGFRNAEDVLRSSAENIASLEDNTVHVPFAKEDEEEKPIARLMPELGMMEVWYPYNTPESSFSLTFQFNYFMLKFYRMLEDIILLLPDRKLCRDGKNTFVVAKKEYDYWELLEYFDNLEASVVSKRKEDYPEQLKTYLARYDAIQDTEGEMTALLYSMKHTFLTLTTGQPRKTRNIFAGLGCFRSFVESFDADLENNLCRIVPYLTRIYYEDIMGTELDRRMSSRHLYELAQIFEVYHKLCILTDVAESVVDGYPFGRQEPQSYKVTVLATIERLRPIIEVFDEVQKVRDNQATPHSVLAPLASVLSSIETMLITKAPVEERFGTDYRTSIIYDNYYGYVETRKKWWLLEDELKDFYHSMLYVSAHYNTYKDEYSGAYDSYVIEDLRFSSRINETSKEGDNLTRVAIHMFLTLNDARLEALKEVFKVAASSLDFSTLLSTSNETKLEKLLTDAAQDLNRYGPRNNIHKRDSRGYLLAFDGNYQVQPSTLVKGGLYYLHCSGGRVLIELSTGRCEIQYPSGRDEGVF